MLVANHFAEQDVSVGPKQLALRLELYTVVPGDPVMIKSQSRRYSPFQPANQFFIRHREATLPSQVSTTTRELRFAFSSAQGRKADPVRQ